MRSSGTVKMLQLGPTRSIFQFFGQGARFRRVLRGEEEEKAAAAAAAAAAGDGGDGGDGLRCWWSW